MKKIPTYIILGALFLTLSISGHAYASEISGTLSTDGGGGTQTTDPSPSPSPSTTPDNSGGHSSEVGGDLTSGSTGGNGTSGDVSGTVTGGTGPTVIGWVGNVIDPRADAARAAASSTDETASTTVQFSENPLAMLDFGPRYGVPGGGGGFVPGAPDAGGTGSYSALSVGSGSGQTALDLTDNTSPFAYLPRSGEGPVIPDLNQSQAAASALAATGLSMPQLVLIALIGLILLGSMGYAISSTNRRPTRAV